MELIVEPSRYGDDLNRIVNYLRLLYKLGEELSKDISPGASKIEYPYIGEFLITLERERRTNSNVTKRAEEIAYLQGVKLCL